MALPTEKRSRLHRWPDFVLFLGAVAFCVFSAKSFTRGPVFTPTPTPAKLSRGLASISQEQPAQEHSTRTLDFSCQDEKLIRTKTNASLFRLTAPNCGSRIERITNQSTGESLMLFERRGGVTTHYFPLKEGTNKILIEWKGAKKSGKRIEVVKS